MGYMTPGIILSDLLRSVTADDAAAPVRQLAGEGQPLQPVVTANVGPAQNHGYMHQCLHQSASQ